MNTASAIVNQMEKLERQLSDIIVEKSKLVKSLDLDIHTGNRKLVRLFYNEFAMCEVVLTDKYGCNYNVHALSYPTKYEIILALDNEIERLLVESEEVLQIKKNDQTDIINIVNILQDPATLNQKLGCVNFIKFLPELKIAINIENIRFYYLGRKVTDINLKEETFDISMYFDIHGDIFKVNYHVFYGDHIHFVSLVKLDSYFQAYEEEEGAE